MPKEQRQHDGYRFTGRRAPIQLFGWELLEHGFRMSYQEFAGGEAALLVAGTEGRVFRRTPEYRQLQQFAKVRGLHFAAIDIPAPRFFRPFTTGHIQFVTDGDREMKLMPHPDITLHLGSRVTFFQPDPIGPEVDGQRRRQLSVVVDTADGAVARLFADHGISGTSYPLKHATALYLPLFKYARYYLAQHDFYVRVAHGLPHAEQETGPESGHDETYA